MKKTLLVLIIATISLLVHAQDFPFDIPDQQALDMKSYSKDTSAHAVVLQEYGTSSIGANGEDDVELTFQYHVRIKIFDAKGFDEGTVEVKLRNDKRNEQREELRDVKGITYYKDENGLTQKVEFDQKKIYNTRDYQYQSTSKFALPGLHNGCIIEYKYTVVSPWGFFIDHFHGWDFQSGIPKIYSEYEVHIPGHFNYNGSIRGSLKLTKNTAELERDCFSVRGAKSDCSNMVYGMKDIPAFIEEDDMTAAKNFRSAIEFELIEYTDPYSGVKTVMTKQWRDIDYQLKISDYFGSQLKKKDAMKEHIAPVIVGKTDELEKAKAIYAYLQKWFKWNDYIGYESIEGIKKAYDTHSGSIASINLALVTALNSAGINTEAVLLSTRDNGTTNDLFPAVNDFNYVIAKANIGDKSYLLDATDPLLPFGMLKLECLNDRGRAFSLDKPSYWVDLDTKQKQKTTYAFDVELLNNGKLKGTMMIFSFGYDAYLKRLAIRKFNSIDEYVESLDEKMSKIKILKSAISGLDTLDQPLQETYDVEIDAYKDLNHERLTFDPFIYHKQIINPFRLAERTYPVDLGMPSEERFVLSLRLPDHYTIENPPQNAAFQIPNQGGRFLANFEGEKGIFSVSYIFQLNKPVYSPEEYPYLKELFNKIILTEKTELVLKKNL